MDEGKDIQVEFRIEPETAGGEVRDRIVVGGKHQGGARQFAKDHDERERANPDRVFGDERLAVAERSKYGLQLTQAPQDDGKDGSDAKKSDRDQKDAARRPKCQRAPGMLNLGRLNSQ